MRGRRICRRTPFLVKLRSRNKVSASCAVPAADPVVLSNSCSRIRVLVCDLQLITSTSAPILITVFEVVVPIFTEGI